MIAEVSACCQCQSGLPFKKIFFCQNLAILLTSFLVLFKKSKAFPCTKPDHILWKLRNNSSKYKCLNCPECPQGYHPSIPCGTTADYGTPLHCVPCPVGTFSDTYDGAPCHLCTKCNERQMIQKNCTAQSNSKCSACKRGYYEDNITGDCHPCSPCCRDKKNVRINDCQRQGMPSDMTCQHHGVPCPQILKSSIGPSLPSVIPKTTPRPVTKQSKLTTHPISFKTYPEELKTSQTPTKFQDLISKQVPFDGKSNAFIIVAIVLLAVLIVCILLAVLLCFVFVKHGRGRKHGKGNDDESNFVELPSTHTSEASWVTAASTDLTLLKDLQQYQSNHLQQDVLVAKVGNPKYGDYQCNNAMMIFKEHGSGLGFDSPLKVAEAIRSSLPASKLIGEISVAPQGFVTVRISQECLSSEVGECLLKGDVSYLDLPRKRVVVDYSSPNIAKEMHVGHLRSTIIGESVRRVLEFCGHEVHGLNHVGDWGTQFGMLIEYMKEAYPNFQDQLPEVHDLQEFYKASKKRFDEDADFKTRAQLAVVDLQAGGEFARSAWQKICEVSRMSFNRIYHRLNISIEERGESFYNAMIPPLVDELKVRKICQESEGAMCIFTPSVSTIPLMAVKSDGGFGYDSTDLAAIYHRLFVMRADWVIYVTDLGQEQHFHMIFDAAKQAGWHKPPLTRCDHMGFGVVQGEDKKKFKTRSGETVKLGDLLNEAVQRAALEINKRVEEQQKDGGEAFLTDLEEQKDAAQKIGIAAVRYFDMKQNRTSNYVFNWDRMLDAKGNSAVFLFYAYARIRSIQRKAGIEIGSIDQNRLEVKHPAERDLALKLLQFPDVIEAILADLHLHHLTDYLWELCNTLTTFYMKCKVLGEEAQSSRLLLCEATRKVLLKSFELLGFTPLDKI